MAKRIPFAAQAAINDFTEALNAFRADYKLPPLVPAATAASTSATRLTLAVRPEGAYFVATEAGHKSAEELGRGISVEEALGHAVLALLRAGRLASPVQLNVVLRGIPIADLPEPDDEEDASLIDP